MKIANEHLLYNDIIESDGHIVREETTLGAALAVITFLAGFALILGIAIHFGLI